MMSLIELVFKTLNQFFVIEIFRSYNLNLKAFLFAKTYNDLVICYTT